MPKFMSLCLPVSPKGPCIAPLVSYTLVACIKSISMSTYITQGTLHFPLFKFQAQILVLIVFMSTVHLSYMIQQLFNISVSTYIIQIVSMSTYIIQGTLHCPLSYTFVFYNKILVSTVSMSTYITQQLFKVSMSTCITQVVSQEVSMSTYITQGTCIAPLLSFLYVRFLHQI